MLFSRALIDLWDPDLKLRNNNKRITILQIVTIPLLISGLVFSFTADIISLPWQLKHIYRDDD